MMDRMFFGFAFSLATFAFAGSTVTGDWQNLPRQQVFAEIARQANLTFEPGAGDAKIHLKADSLPFWNVAIPLAESAGLRIQPLTLAPGERRLGFTSAPPALAKVSSGPLLIALESVIDRHFAPGTVEVTLTSYADPSLPPWSFFEEIAITEAIDSDGNLLVIALEKQLPPAGSLVATHRAVLRKPAGRFAVLRGSLTLLLAEQIQACRIPLPVAPKGQQIKLGNSSYLVQSLRPSGEDYLLDLQIKAPADGGFKAGHTDLLVSDQALLAQDATGARYRISSIQAKYSSKAITAVGYYNYTLTLARPKGGGDISSLIWRIPQQISSVEAPFEFRDVPAK